MGCPETSLHHSVDCCVWHPPKSEFGGAYNISGGIDREGLMRLKTIYQKATMHALFCVCVFKPTQIVHIQYFALIYDGKGK